MNTINENEQMSGPESKQTILIIDDAKENIVVLSRLLKPQGNIIFAQSGEEGLRLAQQHLPELVLLDISMPGMDGFEVLALLKQAAQTSEIPVIFITGIPDSETEEKGLTMGAVDYITKPFSSAVVKARVRHQLKLQRLTFDLKEANARLTQLAMTDPLTGAYNRRYFIDTLNSELARSKRYQFSVCVILFDIDCFKAINDKYGHDIGDRVIKEVVDISIAELRKNDVFCRYGGEEFAILLPETPMSEAAKMAARLCAKFADSRINTGTRQVCFTVSAGLAQFENPGESPETILKRADQALYEAKMQGRNRVVTADADSFETCCEGGAVAR